MGIIVAAGSGSEEVMFAEMRKIRRFKHSLYIGYAARRFNRSFGETIADITVRNGGESSEMLDKCDLENPESAREKIKRADVIYVAGGNTMLLIKRLKDSGIDKMLVDEFHGTDKIFCGNSAGGICWFKYGCADSRQFKADPGQRVKASALGIYPLLFAPHLTHDERRKGELIRMAKTTRGIAGVGFEAAALVIDGKKNVFRTMKLGEDATAIRCYYKKGKYFEEDILSEEYRSLDSLLDI